MYKLLRVSLIAYTFHIDVLSVAEIQLQTQDLLLKPQGQGCPIWQSAVKAADLSMTATLSPPNSSVSRRQIWHPPVPPISPRCKPL